MDTLVNDAIAIINTGLATHSGSLVSELNRLRLCTTMGGVDKDLPPPNDYVLKSGNFRQAMRYYACILFMPLPGRDSDSNQSEHILRIDDVLTGMVYYSVLQQMPDIPRSDDAVRVATAVLVTIATAISIAPSDYEAAWGGYTPSSVVLEDYGEDVILVRTEYEELIEGCEPENRIPRLDLHLAQNTYNKMRFTFMNGFFSDGVFGRNDPIFIPPDRLRDYGEGIANTILEMFEHSLAIEDLADDIMAATGITRFEDGLIKELNELTDTVAALDDTAIDDAVKDLRVRQQVAIIQEDEDDDVFFDTERRAPMKSETADVVAFSDTLKRRVSGSSDAWTLGSGSDDFMSDPTGDFMFDESASTSQWDEGSENIAQQMVHIETASTDED
jgi:hypothetical protein